MNFETRITPRMDQTSSPKSSLNKPCSFDSLSPWLVRARAELAELKGMSCLLIGRENLLQPLLLMEAVEQCALDDQRMTLQEAFENLLYTEPEQSEVGREVIQTKEALGRTFEGNLDLVQMLDALQGFFSSLKASRSIQRNSNLAQITNHSEKLKHLEDIRQFVDTNNRDLDPLIKVLMAFLEIEKLESAELRNSRISRIALNHLLVKSGLLRYPVAFLAGFLQTRQPNYLRIRSEVGNGDNWCPFLKFLMHGITQQARETRLKLDSMLNYMTEFDKKIQAHCPNIHTPQLVQILMTHPVISPLRLSAKLDIHYTTATRYLKKLEEEGLLTHRQSGKYQLYSNPQLINVLSMAYQQQEKDGF